MKPNICDHLSCYHRIMKSRTLSLLVLLASCKQTNISVKPAPENDYNHAKLIAAIDAFVAAGRTPAAYGELAKTVANLRPGMDHAVAEEAELKMIVLAYDPVHALQSKPMSDQVDALALTVWPTLLAPRIEADELNSVRDPKAPQMPPKPGEDPHAYLLRLCVGPLATECKHVVPEYQGDVIDALALRRATERVRNAVSECMACTGDTADPGWHSAVLKWEETDRAANEWSNDIDRRADPDNWPIAGAASEDDPGLAEAELAPRGDIVVGGHAYGPNQQRIDVLRELRGKGDVIALHLRPGRRSRRFSAVLPRRRYAKCQEFARVAVIAREPVYPAVPQARLLGRDRWLRACARTCAPADVAPAPCSTPSTRSAGPGTIARVD